MGNNSPEQALINQFIGHLKTTNDNKLAIKRLFNLDCRNKKYADIEFVSKAGIHWAIEAKSEKSSDKYNAIHKLFGELLKETGRDRQNECYYGVLISSEAAPFFSRLLQAINKTKFENFGLLIPVNTVFLSNSLGMQQITWLELYNYYKP